MNPLDPQLQGFIVTGIRDIYDAPTKQVLLREHPCSGSRGHATGTMAGVRNLESAGGSTAIEDGASSLAGTD